MRQRIINKKLKNDINIRLWGDQWTNSLKVMTDSAEKVFQSDIEMARYSIAIWMANYEMNNIYQISLKKHRVTRKQIHKYFNRLNTEKSTLFFRFYRIYTI